MTAKQTRYIYWCQECGVPLLQPTCENCGTNGIKTVSDLKPVFEKEKDFIEHCIGEKLPDETELLWMRLKTIWFNGARYLSLFATGKPEIVKRYHYKEHEALPNPRPTIEVLRKANASTLARLENEALEFVRQMVADYPTRRPVVSFSGGKDSTLVSHLVRKALQTDDIPHIFSDTTIEFPDTYAYIRSFREQWPSIPWHISSADRDWYEMCDTFRPPSALLPWCCSVFKINGISQIYREVFKNTPVLNFQGIRAAESRRRRNLTRIHTSKKVYAELCAEPILHWKEAEVWIYLLAREIPFNDAYRYGSLRVGCLYCPHQSEYQQAFAEYRYKDLMKKWRDYICNFAASIGKPDPAEYWITGGWKNRIGMDGNAPPAGVSARECSDGDNIVNLLLDSEYSDDWAEFLKPFGKLRTEKTALGVTHTITNSVGEPLFQVWAIDGFPRARVTLLSVGNRKLVLNRIIRQFRKAQVCVYCGSCESICPRGAISTNDRFRINEMVCNNCGNCLKTKQISSGCMALEVFRKRGKQNGSGIQ